MAELESLVAENESQYYARLATGFPMPAETLLASLPSEDDRTQVVLCQHDGRSHVELRQQSFGEGVGWFTQNTVRLDPAQIAGLRGALGVGSRRCPAPLVSAESSPHVLRFESA